MATQFFFFQGKYHNFFYSDYYEPTHFIVLASGSAKVSAHGERHNPVLMWLSLGIDAVAQNGQAER